MCQVRVPGKLILLGEYAVLEGADALVMAVDRYVFVKIGEASAPDRWRISSSLEKSPFTFCLDKDGYLLPDSDMSESQRQNMNFACQAIEAICLRLVALGFSISPFSLEINTKQFYLENGQKLGLGSSAALIVGIILAIARYAQAELRLFPDRDKLFDFCFDVHSQAQGRRGSGIDVAASVFGGIVKYNRQKSRMPEGKGMIVSPHLPSGLNWVPVWTGKSTSTTKLLKSMEKFRSKNLSEFKPVMEKLTDISNKGCQNLIDQNIKSFLGNVKQYYTSLLNLSRRSGIPIISSRHKEIAQLVYDFGGYYKPSGAGEGDLGIAFSDSTAILDKIKEHLTDHQISLLDLQVSESDFSNHKEN